MGQTPPRISQVAIDFLRNARPLMTCVCLCYTVLSVPCSLLINCWERADLLALVCNVFLCFCHFAMWCPGSGVALNCIDF